MRGLLNKNAGRWLWRLAALAAALIFVASAHAAQFAQRGGRGGRGGGLPTGSGPGVPTWDRYVTMADFDGAFQFCRLQFRNASNGDGAGWGVDWPRADQNLSIRLRSSRVPPSVWTRPTIP